MRKCAAMGLDTAPRGAGTEAPRTSQRADECEEGRIGKRDDKQQATLLALTATTTIQSRGSIQTVAQDRFDGSRKRAVDGARLHATSPR